MFHPHTRRGAIRLMTGTTLAATAAMFSDGFNLARAQSSATRRSIDDLTADELERYLTALSKLME